MEIIDFPGRKPRAVASNEKKLLLGPMRFTCDCGNVTDLHLTGGIFRHVDFYCSSCGTHYNLTNPAFKPPAPKQASKQTPPKI